MREGDLEGGRIRVMEIVTEPVIAISVNVTGDLAMGRSLRMGRVLFGRS